MLHELETGLISSKEKMLKLEIGLTKINRNMLDFERNLQGVAKQVKAIRKLGRERQVSQSVIKAIVEKAILEVGNDVYNLFKVCNNQSRDAVSYVLATVIFFLFHYKCNYE